MTEKSKSILAFVIFAILASAWAIYFGSKADQMVRDCKPNHELQVCEFDK